MNLRRLVPLRHFLHALFLLSHLGREHGSEIIGLEEGADLENPKNFCLNAAGTWLSKNQAPLPETGRG